MTLSDTSHVRTGPERWLLDQLRAPRRVLLVTVPLLALVLVGLVVHTGGRHIDLEVYRLGVQAWLAGGDMYGPLPETSAHIALPFIYPPFAALLMPLAVAPWCAGPRRGSACWRCRRSRSALTLYVVARRLWPAGGPGAALSVASIALPLALAVQPGKAIDFAATVPDPRGPPLGLEPVLQTIEFGQINLLLMALVALDCLVARPRWPRGLLIGIAAAIKLTPAVFLLYFLLRRDVPGRGRPRWSPARWPPLLGFLVAPAESWKFWLDNPAGRGERLAVLHQPDLPGGVGPGRRRRPGRTDQLAAAVRRRCSRWPYRSIRRAPAPLALVATAGVGLLVSPTSWSHHWVWVAPALLVAAATAWRAHSARLARRSTVAIGGRVRRSPRTSWGCPGPASAS